MSPGTRVVYRATSGFCDLEYRGVILRSYGGMAKVLFEDGTVCALPVCVLQ